MITHKTDIPIHISTLVKKETIIHDRDQNEVIIRTTIEINHT